MSVHEELIELIPSLKPEDTAAILHIIRAMLGIQTNPAYDSQQDQMAGFYTGEAPTDDASEIEEILYGETTPAKS
ncbi:MAG: hypothetical protein H7X77_05390 [Anaerolineae bacterium]|nr:hypothetical protein [Anaerolineae bacterium]